MIARVSGIAVLSLFLHGVARAAEPGVEIGRRDYLVDAADPGIRLSIREVVAKGAGRVAQERVVVLVHGSGMPSRPAFDVSERSASLAEYLARRGFAVYLFDIRSCGWSTREAAMNAPPDANPGVARSNLAIRDVGAVVDHVRSARGVARVSVLGWSWGGTLAGWYASLQPEKVGRLVLYAAAYSGSREVKPVTPAPAYSLYAASLDALKGRFAKFYPLPDGEPPRPDAIVVALSRDLLESDPTSAGRDPPAIRVPAGAWEDIDYLASGRLLYNASFIQAPTLVVHGGADGVVPLWHSEALMRDLTHAASRKLVVLQGLTHMAQFDPRRGEFFAAVESFLAARD